MLGDKGLLTPATSRNQTDIPQRRETRPPCVRPSRPGRTCAGIASAVLRRSVTPRGTRRELQTDPSLPATHHSRPPGCSAAVYSIPKFPHPLLATNQRPDRLEQERSPRNPQGRSQHRGGGRRQFVAQEVIETRNFAVLSYEFKVDGKTYFGSRVDLGVDSGNDGVVERLRRYPEGKIVEVIYDPSDPSQCILERIDPAKIRAGWFAFAAIVGLIFAGVYGGERLFEFARGAPPRPDNTPFVMFLALFALVLMAFARMIGKKGREMSSWPQTSGEIVESAVATTIRRVDYADSSRPRETTMYVPHVVYKYVVGGEEFRGDNVGSITTSGNPNGPAKFVARFPLASRVDVFYNPDVTTKSTLSPSVGHIPAIIWMLAGAFLFAAAAMAGFVPSL